MDFESILKTAVVLFMVIGLPMLTIFVLPPIGKALARRLEGGAASNAAGEAELAALRERVEELESQQARLLELEERVDFAERLLARQREVGQLPVGPEGR